MFRVYIILQIEASAQVRVSPSALKTLYALKSLKYALTCNILASE
jgi:hypothetical protein